MDYLNTALNYVNARLFRKPVEVEMVEMSRLDAYTNFIYKLISWEDPKLSWLTFIIFNLFYMVIVCWEVRILCIFFSGILSLLLMDLYCDKMNIKEHPNYVSTRQIFETFKGVIRYLQGLKTENPSVFCGSMVTIFVTLSFIGRSVSGHLLLYFVFLFVYFGLYLIQRTPKEYSLKIQQFFVTIRNTEGVVAETELMPFISGKDFNSERDPDLDSLLTDKTQDSVTNSYISGLSTMPSHLEADTFVDELQEDDLLPHSRSTTFQTGPNIDSSSDSDSEHQKHMEFDSSHFNKDSSSSEDENYTKGLKFSDVVDSKVVQDLGKGFYSNLTAMGSNLISNVIQSASQARISSRQDSESDFVFVNKEDAEDDAT